MKGGDDFVFEERKQNKQKDLEEEQEYFKGGGGGGPNGFFSIKTNVYSRQCYSDPDNPGKMICKETKNSSGFDPFNKENNYKKSKEKVYTEGDYYSQNRNIIRENSDDTNEEPSFFHKITNKLKNLFTEDEPVSDYKPSDDPYVKYEKHKNRFKEYPQHNERDFDPYERDFDPYESDFDPYIDQVERMFRNMQTNFLKHSFFDEEDNVNDPFAFFFSAGFPAFNQQQGHTFGEEDFNRNRFAQDDFFSRRSFPGSDHLEKSHLKDYDQPSSETYEKYETKPIKYSDSKIYDV